MKKINYLFVTGVLFVSVLASCGKDDDDDLIIPNEEEVITTLKYTLTPSGGGTAVVMTFRDLDGDGGNAPVITGGTLTPNTTYSAVITLLNETENPVDNITNEVAAEAEEHQFFYKATIIASTFTYSDNDVNDNPINTIEYFYNQSGYLVKEIGKTPNGKIIYQNYEATYEHDEKGNVTKEKRLFTHAPTKYFRIKSYSYNNKDQLVEEKVEDSAYSRNNKHLKYEYNTNGKMMKTLSFSQNEKKWQVIKLFTDDKNGNL